MYMCLCKGLKESHVEQVARRGITTPEGLIAALELDDGDCCGRCARRIDDYLSLVETLVEKAQAAWIPVTADRQQ